MALRKSTIRLNQGKSWKGREHPQVQSLGKESSQIKKTILCPDPIIYVQGD